MRLVSETPEATTASIVANKVKQNPTAPTTPTLYGTPLPGFKVAKAVIQANENLSEILSSYQVPAVALVQLSRLPSDLFDVRRLQAHKPYTIIYREDSVPVARSFVYHPNEIDYVILDFLDDTVAVRKGQHRVDTVQHYLSGTITTSLYHAVLEGGGSPLLVNELADVYAWEIDFFGLQPGDCFQLVYSTLEVGGKTAGFGEILTASFTHLGQEELAYAFDQGDGREYFDQTGESLRKTFLKAPLTFSRISSRFSYSRLHPVLKIRRPHLGVDYAAPTGTPVVAVGDGVVLKAGYSGGAGHMIKIKHNSQYTTAYLHLSRYGQGIKPGVLVKQGQVIGYVGSTGLSTGPHLDFRFYKNGKPVDPLKVDPPSAAPIEPDCMPQFVQVRDRLRMTLQHYARGEEEWLASNQEINSASNH